MIVVLDTNVIVSGILRPYSKAAAILRIVATGMIQLAYDLRILSEYQDVLTRSKFPFAKEDINVFLDQVEKEGVLVSVIPLKFRLSDQMTNPSWRSLRQRGRKLLLLVTNATSQKRNTREPESYHLQNFWKHSEIKVENSL